LGECKYFIHNQRHSHASLIKIKRDSAELENRNLDANLKEFKKFHATRKFRAAAKAIIAVNKMSNLLSVKEGDGPPAPPEDGPTDRPPNPPN
jgi:hypothetical protein